MKPKIVVPTDFSESSQNALAFAVQVAKKINGVILLHHIIEGFQDRRMYGNTEASGQEQMLMNLMDIAAHKKLNAMAEPFKSEGIEINISVNAGSVYGSIAEKIASDNVDLLIIGSHGNSELGKEYLGSNAHKVIRNMQHPVVVLKTKTDLESIKHIVFASEFVEEPFKVTEELNDWQSITGAKVTLLKINYSEPALTTEELATQLNDFALHHHIKNYEIASHSDIDPTHGIIHFAENNKADLVFVGTTFYNSLLQRLWHRKTQVAEDVATHTAIPVITYHIKK